MYKIAVIGDYDSIYGFAALGLDTFPAENPEKGRELFTRLTDGEYAVVYITEHLASQLKHEIDKFKGELLPAIIQIPGISGNTGAGVEGVKKSVETAVGSDILFSNGG
ncbi:MAG: V-type ATP synthase subunit F [Eubacteriales bacterium]|nr:V-type ATP synthase subunit F [Eubacteriales bacterium]